MAWIFGITTILISWYGIFETESILSQETEPDLHINSSQFQIGEHSGTIHFLTDKQLNNLK